MGNAVLTNPVATYVNQAFPSDNKDNVNILAVRTGGAGDCQTLMYFPRPFPLKATILSAKIKFYTTYAMTENVTHTFTFQRLNVAFSSSKVTWNTRPTSLIAGTKPVSKTGVLADKTEWEVDVTDWMQTVSSGGVWYGVRIIENEAVTRWIASELHSQSQYRPRFEVTWSDAPATPTGLSPAGGRAVGVPRPVVRAGFVDVSGSTQLTAIQVQANATDVWTAPSFDSGTVLTSVPELDLAATAFTALADGATIFWRVRLQDAAGIWSGWSASTSFKYDIKGTLTLNNPPSGTPKVEDATPPISWSFAGETQAAYQIQITHLLNNVWVTDWDSGKVSSTATSITVPAGVIKDPSSTGTTYTVTVRIWDNKQREAVPNSPTYVEVIRNFTFIPGATTGTTGLTAVAQDPRPRVVLTWQRATSPDAFNILRNGKVIAAGLLPTDLFVSGTTYTYADESPSPGRALTYSVQGVVGGVASATNATAVVTLKTVGRWLRDPSSGLELCIMGAGDREFTLGSQTGALKAIASTANTVLINQSLGGLEHRVEGELITIYGKTAKEWRDQYIQMRNLRVKKFWLTIDDYTFQVVCDFDNYGRKGIPEDIFKVGFMAYQQDSISSILLGS